ncbi:MAG: SurA N-terminal domain-containing protein [Clostridia bacterium]|nr:SurA N-terminal domain-containing protein [Clostridia bacterium]
MLKKILSALLCAALFVLPLAGCSPSPTAVTVGGRKVDASEYAFYLSYNRIRSGEPSGTILYSAESTALAREAALDQIVTNEVVRLKCAELGLTLSAETKAQLAAEKAALIDSLGGKAAYLDYLKQANLTDRAYDKLAENESWYNLLYDHMQEDGRRYYTDEKLRQYFAEHYATVKYIFFTMLDNDGQFLPLEERQEKRLLAESVLAKAQTPDADFDALMAQYNEDPAMTVGFPVSELEAGSTYYLTSLFSLEENQVSELLTLQDGWYILKRCPVSATVYDENQQDIAEAALDWRFDQTLRQWKTEYSVTVHPVVDQIDLNNLSDYVK